MPVHNDSVVETDGTFFVDLSRASGAAISVGRGTGTIADDHAAPARLAAFATLAAGETPDGRGKASRRR